jgi:hypothetical protein
MLENSKDKMQGREKIKKIFHFAGTGVHAPIAIEAETKEEAEKILNETLNKKVPVEKLEEENK